jgi:hypothetical protein
VSRPCSDLTDPVAPRTSTTIVSTTLVRSTDQRAGTMAVVHVYLIPGTMTRVAGGWCDTCQVSSIWTGPVWRLAPAGVALHGRITGCPDCDTWTTCPTEPS